jgi:Tfp pilus assembly protein PilF
MTDGSASDPTHASIANMTSARAKAAKLQARGDLAGALMSYETALRAAPDDPDLLAAMAGLAEQLEMPSVAEAFWRRVAALQPARAEAIDGQARVLSALGRFDDAVALLQAALPNHAEDARLWNRLGVTLTQAGRPATALTFFDESVRLDGRSSAALHNRGGAWFDLGRFAEAQTDFDAAAAVGRSPSDLAMIEFSAATLRLARGDLEAAWDAYETRHSPHLPKAVTYDAPGDRWTPDVPLEGRRLLVLAEQGLGDEIMFSGLIPDALDEIGPQGRLGLAVEPRLVDLFRRSFPAALITGHTTTAEGPARRRSASFPDPSPAFDLWTPLASLTRRFRTSLADFQSKPAYLRPDPARVAHWRAWLGPGPAAGLTWRSGKLSGDRRRNYPPLEAWAPVLRTRGVRFVNLQYGDCADELLTLSQCSQGEILEPPGIDLRNDLDELAALCVALDVVVGIANATTQLAGACGSLTILLTPPAVWPLLGTDRYPWHPAARAVIAPTIGDWTPAMAEAAEILAARVG